MLGKGHSGAGVDLEEVAEEVLRSRTGREAHALRRARRGNAASVFEARVGSREVVLKLYPDPERARGLSTVAAALRRARGAEIPVPLFRKVGVARRAYAFALYDRISGACADACSAGSARELWKGVGRQIARANTLRAPGYGRMRFGDPGSPCCFPTWREFIEPEIDRLTEARLSEDFPTFGRSFRDGVRRRLRQLCEWRFSPTLVHGNITGSNVIVDPETGELRGIIDWDSLLYGRSPHFELATALLWMEPEAEEGFLAGYGMSPEQYAAIQHDVETARLFYLTGYLLWHLLSGNDALAALTRSEMERVLG